MTNKKLTKIIIFFIAVELIFSPSVLPWAEESLFGNAYKDYLNKIRSGYNPDVFTSLDRGQKEKIAKKKQVEELVNSSKLANADLDISLQKDNLEKTQNSQVFQNEIIEQRKQREKNAAANGEFQYIVHGDGKKEYFKDGLVSRIENEKVFDEFGNVSTKNTNNMQYNDKRLLTSYESTLTDTLLGNVTKIHWWGATYTDDSVFYGNKDSNANKTLTGYNLKEVDPAGNVRLSPWKALSYEGKLLRSFSQTIEDSVYGVTSFTRSNINYANNDPERATSYHEEGVGTDGLVYTSNRTNINYNSKGSVADYHELKTITQLDDSKVDLTTDAQFEYLEADGSDRILKSITTNTTKNPDGSYRTEIDTTAYDYDVNNKLINASGSNQFTGQEGKWYEYKDTQEHILSRKKDKKGDVTYSYVDPDNLKGIIVPEGQVNATLKDGNKFSGTSEIQFEILYGKPMAKEVNSLTYYYNSEDDKLFRSEDSTLSYNNGLKNNLQRVLDSQERTKTAYPFLDPNNTYIENSDIATTYIYDERGNLIDTEGKGQRKGHEYSSQRGWAFPYTSAITIDYEVILGKPLRKTYDEEKKYE